MRVAQITIDEILRNILLFHQQLVMLGLTNNTCRQQVVHPLLISSNAFFSVFGRHIVPSRLITFLNIHRTVFQRLVGKRIVEQTGLWKNMFNIHLLAEKFLPRNICIGIQGLETIFFQLRIQFVANNVIVAHVLDAKLRFQDLLYPFMFRICLADGCRHIFTFLGAFLQLARQLYMDFIRLTIRIDHRINHIDHLIKDFLNNRIAKTVARKKFKMVLIDLPLQFLFC